MVGQPLWLEARATFLPLVTADHNLGAYAGDFERLLCALEGAKRSPVVLSGDVHFSRALKIQVGRRGPSIVT